MTCREIIETLEELAPPACAMDWDNPGLMVGRREREVRKVYIALDVTEQVVNDAIENGCDLILTHHPMIFDPLKKVNDDDFKGRWIIRLIEAGVNVYSMHTNFDIAPGCMGDICADMIGITGGPLEVTQTAFAAAPAVTGEAGAQNGAAGIGIGKAGALAEPCTLRELAGRIKQAFGLPYVLVYTDDEDRVIHKAAVCPGSAKGMTEPAVSAGCEVLIGGDFTHHPGLDAVSAGISVIDAGHYGLEHVFIRFMERFLKDRYGGQLEILTAPFGLPAALV